MANPELPSSTKDIARSIVQKLGGNEIAANVLVARAGEIKLIEGGKLQATLPGRPEIRLTFGEDRSVTMETFVPGKRVRKENLYEVDRIIADEKADPKISTLSFRGKYSRGFIITTKRIRVGVLSLSQGLYY